MAGFRFKSLSAERAHHYPTVLRRSRAAARHLGLRQHRLADVGGDRLIWLHSRTAAVARPKVLLSAGIHGDEPAASEALLQFLETRKHWFQRCDFTLFPCLNPWGLRHNNRLNAQGLDLNRCYARKDVSPIVEARAGLQSRGPFDLAICLHEDYDGAGLYLYELSRSEKSWGRELLRAAQPYLPTDLRKKIEGRTNDRGLIQRSLTPQLLKAIKARGMPEAVHLALHHAPRVYTLEAPSEFSLEHRVAGLLAATERALELLLKKGSVHK